MISCLQISKTLRFQIQWLIIHLPFILNIKTTALFGFLVHFLSKSNFENGIKKLIGNIIIWDINGYRRLRY